MNKQRSIPPIQTQHVTPTWKELYAEADKAANMPVNKGKSSKRKVLPDDSINKLKKRMMNLSSYLFPHIEK